MNPGSILADLNLAGINLTGVNLANPGALWLLIVVA